MIGNMISRIRKEKGITKTKLADLTEINIGHLTHIEKGERNPSHKALKSICSSLNIPYQQLLYTYDKEITEEHKEIDYLEHISYNTIPAISKIDSYISCPSEFSNASFAYKIHDNSMTPIIKEGTYAFIEINGVLLHKDIGLFQLNNEFLIRRLLFKKGKFVLRAENKNIKDITVSSSDHFQIIGKVYI